MTNAGEQRRVKRHQAYTGVVVSTGGDKTIRVVVDNLVRHPRYGKYIRRRTRLAVHDPLNTAAMGDVVEIISCRRMSKTKSWRLARVLRANRTPVEALPEPVPADASPQPPADRG